MYCPAYMTDITAAGAAASDFPNLALGKGDFRSVGCFIMMPICTAQIEQPRAIQSASLKDKMNDLLSIVLLCVYHAGLPAQPRWLPSTEVGVL